LPRSKLADLLLRALRTAGDAVVSPRRPFQLDPSSYSDQTLPVSPYGLATREGRHLEEAITRLMDEDKSIITIGLGEGFDISPLDDELVDRDIHHLDRDLLVLRIDWDPYRGYTINKGMNSFGVFYCRYDWETWRDLGWAGVARLQPMDRISLGSSPGDGITLSLPDIPGFTAVRRERPPEDAIEYSPQEALKYALRHWDYEEITLGTDETCVVRFHEDEGLDFRIRLSRNPREPGAGYRVSYDPVSAYPVFLRKPDDTWQFTELQPLRGVTLRGPGNVLRVLDHTIILPPPIEPIPSPFQGRRKPTREEIAMILGVSWEEYADADRMRKRYRSLVRRLHPDLSGGTPGTAAHLLDVKTVWEAYTRTEGSK